MSPFCRTSPPIIVIRAQFLKKMLRYFFVHALAKMLSFKIMLRLKCSDENKCADKTKCSDKNSQLKKKILR